MTNAPIAVWNEVRFTSEGISISLFSESPDGGAILEDEMWFTYDELQEKAPSEPLSLRLSSESREALSEQHEDAVVGNLIESENLDDKSEIIDDNPSSEQLLAYMGLLEGEATDGSESIENLPEVGQIALDRNAPDWSNDDRLEVVEISDKSAGEYFVDQKAHMPDEYRETVANANPSCDPDEPVIEAEYVDGTGESYGFPVSRLEW